MRLPFRLLLSRTLGLGLGPFVAVAMAGTIAAQPVFASEPQAHAAPVPQAPQPASAARLHSSQSQPSEALVGLADAEALQATVFGAPPEALARLPQEVPLRELNLAIEGAMPVPEVFWFNSKLRVWYSAQEQPAPLVIAIAGTGSGGNSGKLAILRAALYGAGYHVLTVPSPTFPRFIVAASSTGVAGDLQQDGRDLHRALRQVVAALPADMRITAVHVIGYSLGGANAAMVKAVDQQVGGLGVQRVVMINPPVSLFASIGRIDRLFETSIGTDDEDFERLYQRLYAQLAGLYRASAALEMDQEFLLGAAAQVLSGAEEFSAAIALTFRLALMNMFFAGDLYAGTGVVTDPANPPGKDDSLVQVQRALRTKPFAAYFQQVFAPYYMARRPGASAESLIADNHLEIIGGLLRGDGDIHAQANADDLILDAGELQWLREVFGSRIAVYPSGGHLGNMGTACHVQDLLAMLAGRFTAQECAR